MIVLTTEENIKNSTDLIEANKKRISKIKCIITDNVDDLFDRLIELLEENLTEVTEFLEKQMFFEVILKEFVDELCMTYKKLDNERKKEYINCLKESYKTRGIKGYQFTFSPIIGRYKGIAFN